MLLGRCRLPSNSITTFSTDRNASVWPPLNRIQPTEVFPFHSRPGVILDTGGEDDPRVGAAVLKRLQNGGRVVRFAVSMGDDARFCGRSNGRGRSTEEDQQRQERVHGKKRKECGGDALFLMNVANL